jgi:hypothetical protein
LVVVELAELEFLVIVPQQILVVLEPTAVFLVLVLLL